MFSLCNMLFIILMLQIYFYRQEITVQHPTWQLLSEAEIMDAVINYSTTCKILITAGNSMQWYNPNNGLSQEEVDSWRWIVDCGLWIHLPPRFQVVCVCICSLIIWGQTWRTGNVSPVDNICPNNFVQHCNRAANNYFPAVFV